MVEPAGNAHQPRRHRRRPPGSSVSGDERLQDVAAQLQHASQLDARRSARELARLERGSIGLADRFAGNGGTQVRLTLITGGVLSGTVAEVGADWVTISDGDAATLVRMDAVQIATGLSQRSRGADGFDRRSLRSVLSDWEENRRAVVVAAGVQTLRGRIAAVWADHLDLRGDQRGADLLAIPFSAIATVTSVSR
ncbi:hypothetical protein M3A96_04905 [Helcobacillus massiliensis]|uniref:hypothetical protein n=1 Tax=Helcobacillus massiliensis TaxID=521392 RepID=UPI0021A565C5|nr:hypothetical protein [Helcobacillus massiliensis]MCT1557453.1 hypothetical protein [Helcobacillus massiliensis]MCT2036366.1 hypothetical protein [Helcobacillus massiliensis]MCT2331892.1 hypothetical protein [Helcobacillus massiliensis]